jgi:hypothetical protein
VVSNAYAKFVTNYRQAINNSAENPSELKRAIGINRCDELNRKNLSII